MIKLAAAATGQIARGQENGLGDHYYRSHKKAICKYEKLYYILFSDWKPLDPNKSGVLWLNGICGTHRDIHTHHDQSQLDVKLRAFGQIGRNQKLSC